MTLSEAIAGYVEHIRHERGLAKTTCLHYQSWLRAFSQWAAANGYPDLDLNAFNPLTLRRYQMEKAKAGARPRTIHSAFHALRGLGEFLVDQHILTDKELVGTIEYRR